MISSTSVAEEWCRGHHVADRPRSIRERERVGKRRALALVGRLALLGSIAALPTLFGAWVDPLHLLGAHTAEREMARVLASGRKVTDYNNYDDRALEREVAALRTGRPDVLVIGDSRVQAMPAAAFPGKRFVNAGLSAARLDAMFGAYGLYDSDDRRPHRLVIGIDPWTEVLEEVPAWGALRESRAELLRRAGLPDSPVGDRIALARATALRIASPEHLRIAAISVRHHGLHGIQWRATDRAENPGKTRLPDGTVVWPPTPASTGPAIAERFALENHASNEASGESLEDEPVPDDRLEPVIEYVRATGVEVTLLLPPYSPLVYDALSQLPGAPLAVVESHVREMAERTGAEVVGGYDPRPLGVVAEDFFDESHPRPELLIRLMEPER